MSDNAAGMQRRGLRTDFVINLGGAAASLVVMMVTVPLFVGQIGTARYGALSLIWILLGTMGFLDLGLLRAVVNVLARTDPADKPARERVFVTALGLNLAMGALGGAALLFGGIALFSHFITVPPAMLPEVTKALPWVAALLPLALMNGVGIGCLESRDHFLAANLLQLAGTLAIQIVPLAVAFGVSPQIDVVVPAAALARGASVLVVLAFAWRLERSGGWPRPDRRTTAGLLRYGSWVSVSNIISPLLVSLDQVVLAAVLGVASVTYYAVPFSLVMKSQIIAAAASRTLFPRMSRAPEGEARDLARRAVAGLCYSYGAICLAGVFLIRPFLVLWMGPGFAVHAAPLGQILLVGAWCNGLAFISFELLQARGRPHLPALLHVLEIGPFLAALWYLTHRFGAVGTALAWSGRMALDSLLFMAVSRHGVSAVLRLAPMALVLAGAALYAHLHVSPLPEALALAAAALLLTAGLDATLRTAIAQAARQVRQALRAA